MADRPFLSRVLTTELESILGADSDEENYDDHEMMKKAVDDILAEDSDEDYDSSVVDLANIVSQHSQEEPEEELPDIAMKGIAPQRRILGGKLSKFSNLAYQTVFKKRLSKAKTALIHQDAQDIGGDELEDILNQESSDEEEIKFIVESVEQSEKAHAEEHSDREHSFEENDTHEGEREDTSEIDDILRQTLAEHEEVTNLQDALASDSDNEGEAGAILESKIPLNALSLLEKAELSEESRKSLGDTRVLAPLRSARASVNSSRQNALLRLEPLQQIQKQLRDYRHRIGQPSAIFVHQKYILVGTTGGITLVFDHFQTLIKPAVDSSSHGAVTCLALDEKAAILLVGSERGTCTCWDLPARSVLKTVDSKATRPIVNVFFLPSSNPWFVTVDTVGTTYLWKLSKLAFFWQLSDQCLLDGSSTGSIMAGASFFSTPRFPHVADRYSLIALANEALVMFICLTPQARIVHRHARASSARPGVVPCMAWRTLQLHEKPVVEQASVAARQMNTGLAAINPREQMMINNPVIAIGRGPILTLIAVLPADPATTDGPPLTFTTLGSIDLKVDIMSVSWLVGQILIVITADYNMIAIDPVSLRELERLSIRNIALTTHSLFGTNESREPCSQQSIGIAGNGMVVLGDEGMLSAKAMTWSERIQLLEEKGRWIDALSLSLDFFDGTAAGALGLPRDARRLQTDVESRLVSLLTRYVDLTFSPSLQARSKESRETELKVVAGIAVDFCSTLRRFDILYGLIFAKFQHIQADGVFLELLQPYILSGALTTVGPEVLGPLLTHFASQGKLAIAEQCLLRLNFTQSLAPRVVAMCRRHRITGALLHVYTKSLGMYGMALAETIALGILFPEDSDVFNSAQVAAPNETAADRIYRRLFYFFKLSMEGKAFPSRGKLPKDYHKLIRAQLIQILFTPHGPPRHPDYTPKAADFPWLTYFLHGNAQEFLGLMWDIFDNPDWTGKSMDDDEDEKTPYREHSSPEADDTPAAVPVKAPTNNRFASFFSSAVNNLKETLTSDSPARQNSVSSSQGGRANSTVSAEEAPAAAEVEEPEDDVLTDYNLPVYTIDPPEMKKVFQVLSVCVTRPAPSRGPEGLIALQTGPAEASETLNTFRIPPFTPTPADLDTFYSLGARVIAAKKVESTLNYVLDLFRHLCGTESSSGEGAAGKQAALLELLKATPADQLTPATVQTMLKEARAALFYDLAVFLLAQQDNLRELLTCYLKAASSPICATTPEDCFDWLQDVLIHTEDQGAMAVSPYPIAKVLELRRIVLQRIPELINLHSELAVNLVERRFQRESDQVLMALGQQPRIQFLYMKNILSRSDEKSTFTPQMDETYVQLLCEFEPDSVYNHLKVNISKLDIESLLALCQQYKIDDAQAYLLERTGDVMGAILLITKSMGLHVRRLYTQMLAEWSEDVIRARAGSVTSTMVKTTTAALRKELALTWIAKLSNAVKVTQLQETAIEVCERSLDANELWNTVLDHLLDTGRFLREMRKEAACARGPIEEKMLVLLQEFIGNNTQQVMLKMMHKVPFAELLNKITVQSEGSGAGEWREFKPSIQAMFDAYSYEKHIYSTANHLCGVRTFVQVEGLQRDRATCIQPRADLVCDECKRPLNIPESLEVLVYGCNHVYHDICFPSFGKVALRDLRCKVEKELDEKKELKEKAGGPPRAIVGAASLNTSLGFAVPVLSSAALERKQAQDKEAAEERARREAINAQAKAKTTSREMERRLQSCLRSMDSSSGLRNFNRSSRGATDAGRFQSLLTLSPLYDNDNLRPVMRRY
jgi:WD40 repeat protein